MMARSGPLPGQTAEDAARPEPPSGALNPARWVERHGDVLFQYALLHLGDRDSAEERVQETFVAALAGRERFRGDSSERTWLVGILRHKICDALRRREREPREEGPDPAGMMYDGRGYFKSRPPQWPDLPETGPDRRELRRAMMECLARLDPSLRDALTLRTCQELNVEAIREILGVSSTNLSTRLYRARLWMRRCLERAWPGGGTLER